MNSLPSYQAFGVSFYGDASETGDSDNLAAQTGWVADTAYEAVEWAGQYWGARAEDLGEDDRIDVLHPDLTVRHIYIESGTVLVTEGGVRVWTETGDIVARIHPRRVVL